MLLQSIWTGIIFVIVVVVLVVVVTVVVVTAVGSCVVKIRLKKKNLF